MIFSRRERDRLGLRGLLPYRVATSRQMVDRVMTNLDRLASDIDRYVMLSGLQERNERLFYQTVIEHIDRIMPLIYTPTVGEACKEFSQIARYPKGFFITPDDRGQIRRILAQLAQAGHPRHRRHRRTAHPGPRRSRRQRHGHSGRQARALHRLRGNRSGGVPAGDARRRHEQRGAAEGRALSRLSAPAARRQARISIWSTSSSTAVQARYPNALIQFEDFLTPNAYALLEKYRHRVLCFNDDIQGTAAVSLWPACIRRRESPASRSRISASCSLAPGRPPPGSPI